MKIILEDVNGKQEVLDGVAEFVLVGSATKDGQFVPLHRASAHNPQVIMGLCENMRMTMLLQILQSAANGIVSATVQQLMAAEMNGRAVQTAIRRP